MFAVMATSQVTGKSFIHHPMCQNTPLSNSHMHLVTGWYRMGINSALCCQSESDVKVKAKHLYSTSSEIHHCWSALVWITQLLHYKHTIPAFHLVSIHQTAPPTMASGSNHMITAYYLLIDPWVDLFFSLHLTCSWWVTIFMGKPSAVGQVTRQTQPFILLGSINE